MWIHLNNNVELFSARDDVRKHLSYITQEFFFIENKVEECFEEKSAVSLMEIKTMLIRLKLLQPGESFEKCLKKDIATLSGGEKQRLILAKEFLSNRRIVLLDEVTSALDAATELEVINLVKEYSKKKIIIAVTHSKKFAEAFNSSLKLNVDKT